MLNLQAVKRPVVAAFLGGQLLALFSGLFGLSALSWLVASKFGASGIAQMYAVQAAISCLSYVLLSPLGDRLNKLRLIRTTSWLIALRSVLLAAAATCTDVSLTVIIALQAVNAVGMSVIVPARAALLPELVRAAELRSALGMQQTIFSVGRILGPACAGLALVKFSAAACLDVHAALMVMVCILNFFIGRTEPKAASPVARRRVASWCNDILDSWRIRLRIPIERYLSLLSIALLVAYLPAITILVPLRIQAESWGTQVFGMTEASLSVGALVAGLGRITKTTKQGGRFALFMIVSAGQGVFLLVASLTSTPLIFSAAYFFVGFCATTSALVLGSQRMLAIPKNFRAWLSSSGMTLTTIAGSIGSSLIGLSLKHLPLVVVYPGVATFVTLLAVLYLFIPRFKEFLNLLPEQAEQWYEGEFLAPSNCEVRAPRNAS